jgi:hypothetical protein
MLSESTGGVSNSLARISQQWKHSVLIVKVQVQVPLVKKQPLYQVSDTACYGQTLKLILLKKKKGFMTLSASRH